MGLLDDPEFNPQGYGGILGSLMYRSPSADEATLAQWARDAAAAHIARRGGGGNAYSATVSSGNGAFPIRSAPFGFAGPGALNFDPMPDTGTQALAPFVTARPDGVPPNSGPLPDEATQAQQAREAAAARLRDGTRSINRANATPLTRHDFAGAVRSAANETPIIGPFINKADAATNAFIAPAINPLFKSEDRLNDATLRERYDHALRVQNEMDEDFSRNNPHLDALAKFAGGALGWKGMSRLLPWALGNVGGSLPERMLRGAGTRAAISGVDAAERGEDPGDAARRGAVKGFLRPARRQWLGP